MHNIWDYSDRLAAYISKYWVTESSSLIGMLEFFLPEVLLFFLIVFILVKMIIALHFQQNRKNVAIELLGDVRVTFYVVSTVYAALLAQQTFGFFSDGHVVISAYTVFLKLLLSLASYTILEFLPIYVSYKNRHFLELPLIFSLASFFMLFLISANHLFMGVVLLMGFSINLYILILFEALNPLVREAGIKYFYLSAFSSGLIVMGVFLLMFVFKTGTFTVINFMLTAQTSHFISRSEILIVFGVVLMLIGLLFKLSAFPGHLWAAEVYGGSPRPVTILLMINSKIAVFAFTLSLLTQAFDAALNIWQPILITASFGSMLWGCLGALLEKRLKRFFAYASINQIGFILFGVSCGTFEGYRNALLYFFLYILMSISIVALFLYPYRLNAWASPFLVYLTDLRGLGKSYSFYNWKLSWVLTLILFSMAGVPPAAGFFGKYFLLLEAYECKLIGLVLIGLLTSLISMYYYLKIVKLIWFELPKVSKTILVRTIAGVNVSLTPSIVVFFLYGFILFTQIILDIFDKLCCSLYFIMPICYYY